MWPWKQQRAEAAEARRQAEDAGQQANAAEARRLASERLAAHSHNVTAALRREIDKNGWTELLQHAWGGR